MFLTTTPARAPTINILTTADPVQHRSPTFRISITAKSIHHRNPAKMQATLANFVLAALATMTSASPLAAKDAAGAAPVQELAIAAAPAAAGDVTHLEVCIDGYFGGRCQNLANQKGDCFRFFSVISSFPGTSQRRRERGSGRRTGVMVLR